VFEHAFSRASDEQVVHRAVTVRAHDDQIRIENLRLVQNFFGNSSGRLV
jgi:hypothetical protein